MEKQKIYCPIIGTECADANSYSCLLGSCGGLRRIQLEANSVDGRFQIEHSPKKASVSLISSGKREDK